MELCLDVGNPGTDRAQCVSSDFCTWCICTIYRCVGILSAITHHTHIHVWAANVFTMYTRIPRINTYSHLHPLFSEKGHLGPKRALVITDVTFGGRD